MSFSVRYVADGWWREENEKFQSQVQGFQEVFRVSKQKNDGQYFILSLKHIRL